MLKWTAQAFALAAAIHLGSAAQAQNADADAGADLIPPVPGEVESDVEAEAANAEEDADVPRDDVDVPRDDADIPRGEAIGPPPAGNNDVERTERDDADRELPDVTDEQSGPVPHEDRFRPADGPDDSGISERVRNATANLDIDDETRSRYRWNNGEWWFKTTSGGWKYHRDGEWHAFDPTTYQPPQPGILYSDGGAPSTGSTTIVPSQGYSFAPQSTYGSGGVIVPQSSSSGGYYYGNQPYRSYRPGQRAYRGGYGWNDGYYGRGYGYGYGGYQGYNPRNDRYYGRGPYGGRYSIEGDRYRGGVIGSQIGGQIGGRGGAIIGGAIGAEAAD